MPRSLVFRLASSSALAALCLLGTTSAQAAPTPATLPPPAVGVVDEQSEFEKGRNAYRAQKYDEAESRFLKMLDPQHGTLHDKVLIKQARMYLAATLVAEHVDATEWFETILTEDRDYEPDPLAFPTDVVNAFIDTRARLRAKLEEIEREQYRRAAERRARDEAAKAQQAARLKLLEKLAAQAEVTQQHSRWIALLPFGIGQFQNGQRALGWFFLTAEAAFLATGTAAVPVYYVDLANSRSTYNNNPVGSASVATANQYLERANAAQDVNLIAYGALVVTVITGAIQAEAAYVPEVVQIRPRVVPDVPLPAPAASPPAISLSFGAAPVRGVDGKGVSGATVSLTARF